MMHLDISHTVKKFIVVKHRKALWFQKVQPHNIRQTFQRNQKTMIELHLSDTTYTTGIRIIIYAKYAQNLIFYF